MNAAAADQHDKDPRIAEIRALLNDCGGGFEESFDIDEPLISSGLLDSLALFQLVLWVEGKTGRRIDPNVVDVSREFDSVRLIVNFIDRATPSQSPVRPRTRHGDRYAVDIVKYTPAHKAAVVELQTQLWGDDPGRNRRYLEWKYEHNPYRAKPEIFLALRQGEVVGMRGFYGSRWRAGESTTPHDVLVADDLVVGDAHRNRGVVHQLMQAALDELSAAGEEFVFNLSGSPLTVLSSLAMGWRSAGAFEPIERRSIGTRLRARMRQTLMYAPLLRRSSNSPTLYSRRERNPFAHFDRHIGETTSVNGVRIDAAQQPRCDAMAELIARLHADGRIRHVRDTAYYNWRLRSPARQYRFVYAGGETLDGFVILNGDVRPNACVRIVDLEATDDHTRAALLASATRTELFHDMYAWSATLRTFDRSHLRSVGFESVAGTQASHGQPCMLVRPAGDVRRPEQSWELGGVRLLDSRNWDMRMIFSMVG